jgi:hypothetical protein
MKKTTIAAAISLAAFTFGLPAGADDDDTLARFSGGIGVIPTGSSNTVVRGVNPAGQIWVIEKLDARVRANGHIKVEGKGLILGAGNDAGRATGQRVIATLICNAAGTVADPFIQRSTDTVGVALAGVELAPDGDFKIDDMLSPAPPFNCASPMLLIRNAANGGWFAVGILKQ